MGRGDRDQTGSLGFHWFPINIPAGFIGKGQGMVLIGHCGALGGVRAGSGQELFPELQGCDPWAGIGAAGGSWANPKPQLGEMSATAVRMDPGLSRKELLLCQVVALASWELLMSVPLLLQDSLSFLQGGFSNSSRSLFGLCV